MLAILYVLIFSVGACTRRGLNHGTSDAELDCDTTCEADVRSHAVSAGRLQVTEAQWQAAFASGKAALAQDPEWLALIAENKQMACQIIARTADPQKARDLLERVGKKTNDDIYGDPTIGKAIEPGDNPAVDAARAKVVKVHLIRYTFARDLHSCP
jgi:hypothetical protein